jgi:hypothetical protein
MYQLNLLDKLFNYIISLFTFPFSNSDSFYKHYEESNMLTQIQRTLHNNYLNNNLTESDKNLLLSNLKMVINDYRNQKNLTDQELINHIKLHNYTSDEDLALISIKLTNSLDIVNLLFLFDDKTDSQQRPIYNNKKEIDSFLTKINTLLAKEGKTIIMENSEPILIQQSPTPSAHLATDKNVTQIT